MIRNLAYTTLVLLAALQTALPQGANQYAISTLAGSFTPGDGLPAANALLSGPLGATTDKDGNIYFIDQRDSSVRKISTTGILSTIAVVPSALDVAFDRSQGNLIVSTDRSVHRVTLGGLVTQLAGGRSIGSSGDGGPAINALAEPITITVDSKGVIYFAEPDFHRVRRITTDGTITTFAGIGTFGFSGDGTAANQAKLDTPNGVAVDGAGNVYISDYFNGRLRRVTPNGVISTYAGNGFLGQPADGVIGPNTRFGGFANLSSDDAGNLLVCDSYWDMVFRISNTGSVKVLAGTGVAGFSGDGGSGRSAQLDGPFGVVGFADGSVVIADTFNNRMRKVGADGKITTIAGLNHFAGDNGQATAATLNRPSGVARDSAGIVYLTDRGNHRIRRIDLDGTIHTVAGTGRRGYDSDGGPASTALLNAPLYLSIGPDDSLYFVDSGTLRVRKITPAGIITLVAGSGDKGDSGDNGPAKSARFQSITGLVADRRGNLFISDGIAGKIRRVDLVGGTIYPFAGTGTADGPLGDGGLATAARLGFPADLTFDGRGRIYVSEVANGIVRRIDATGLIETFAGDGTFHAASEGSDAKQSGIGIPGPMAFDNSGNLLLASTLPNHIYSISTSGIISRIAGGGQSDVLGDGGPARVGSLLFPFGITTDPSGNVYIADTGNDRVRKLTVNNPAKLEITGGNNQQGSTGQAAAQALRVKLTGAANVGLPDQTIAYRVVSGSATVSSTTTVTDATGTAGVGLTFGPTAGPVKVEASFTGLPTVSFDLNSSTSTGGNGGDGIPAVTNVIMAGAFGGKVVVTSGGWIEIYGTNLAPEARPWADADFTGDNAPTVLSGVRVKINGQSAFVGYISPTQINVQAPAGLSAGNVAVEITTPTGTSAAFSIPAAARVPSLLAPPSFASNGKQYITALFPDSVYVGRANLVTGVNFRTLKGGDRFLMFGVGFGSVTPAVAPGVIARAANALPNVVVKIGGVNATVEYAGLASGLVGLYQFNIVAPTGLAGDQRVEVSVDGIPVEKELWITYDSSAPTLLLPQLNDGLQMRRLGEQIRERQSLDRVPARQ